MAKINHTASYVLLNSYKYGNRGIVRFREVVKAMEGIWKEWGSTIDVSSGGKNWLFRNPFQAEGYRIRLCSKIHLEVSSEYGYRKVWSSLYSWKLAPDIDPLVLARFIAKKLGAAKPSETGS